MLSNIISITYVCLYIAQYMAWNFKEKNYEEKFVYLRQILDFLWKINENFLRAQLKICKQTAKDLILEINLETFYLVRMVFHYYSVIL